MESQQITDTKKRTLGHMHAQELQWKLQSKADFIAYLDKHRKSHPLIDLTFL